jgi:photosystem II stability/assembly factor-like uncharacterized protein
MNAAAHLHWAFGLSLLLALATSPARGADLADTYTWKPIAIGAGGYADGMIISATDPNVRFLRDDTGQYYRWSAADSRWLPMVVQNDDGSGFGADIIPQPSHEMPVVGNSGGGFALDPNDNKVLYMYLSLGSASTYGSLPYNVYKSVDGGKTFKATSFNSVAGFTMKENDAFSKYFRMDGDSIMVDPNNPLVVYIGTGTKGLFRSTDAGDTWSAMTGGGLPSGVVDINILPYKTGGTAEVGGITVSRVLYLVAASDRQPSANDVYLSKDGGQTWASTGLSGLLQGGECLGATLDANTGALYVPAAGGKGALWKYGGSAWTKIKEANTGPVAVDPNNPDYLLVAGGTPSRSTDGGKTWTEFSNVKFSYAGSQGFSGTRHPTWCSMAKVLMDTTGAVWMIEGNDGVLTWKFDPTAKDARWTPSAAGLENFCSMDIAFPKDWGGKAVVSVMDECALVINDLDTFDVTPIEPQGNLSNGQVISVCPNDPNTFSVIASEGASFITTDGGKSYEKLSGLGTVVQISRRGDWAAGSDHLVWLFPGAAWYSRDGGHTWTKSATDFRGTGLFTSPWNVNRAVVADPFTPDKFCTYLDWGGFWVTTDGGATWSRGANPPGTPNGYQLLANYAVRDDLWLDTLSGLFHSTDAGRAWQPVAGNGGLPLCRCPITLGKGSGLPGAAPYSIYYIYKSNQPQQPAQDYGIYRSTDAGASWDRIARWPAGLMCPALISASWDTYGLVGVAVGGQGFVYGMPKAPAHSVRP